MKSIIIILLLTFSFVALADESFPPSQIRKAIKVHVEGEINSIEKDRIKGFEVYVVSSSNDDEDVEHFFSESGRLIHIEEHAHDDEEEHEDDEELEDDEEHEDDEELETFTTLEHHQLPENIQKAIKEQVKGEHLEFGREVAYYVETKEDDQIVLYVFNEHGELIEREEHDYEEHEDDEEHEEHADEEEHDDEED
ncbi:MAG: hypothetical protein MK132_18660 [Lentisphaerales bacterium]|nr:hypothetical protein [Lentisphaerales bacterium]